MLYYVADAALPRGPNIHAARALDRLPFLGPIFAVGWPLDDPMTQVDPGRNAVLIIVVPLHGLDKELN
jgi:hypothetical protein